MYISHYVTILFWSKEATKDVELVVIFMIIPASFSVEACAVFAVLAAVSNPPDESYYSPKWGDFQGKVISFVDQGR